MRRAFVMLLMIVPLVAACNLSTRTEEQLETDDIPTVTSQPEEIGEPDTLPTFDLAPTRTPAPTGLPIPTSAGPGGSSGPAAPTAIAPPTLEQVAPVLQPVQPGQRAYALNTNGAVTGQGVTLLNVPIYHYAQNPADPARFAVVDDPGMLYITGPGGTGAFRIEQSPYSQFPASNRAENNSPAEIVTWSPNGQYVAFLVNGDREAADGVWYFQPGAFAPIQLLVDCPREGFVGCNIVSTPDTVRQWASREIYWSQDSTRILVNAELPQEGRRGLIVLPTSRDERVRDQRPPVLRYDYGTWGADGRILTSGRDPDGAIIVAWINADGGQVHTIFNAGANGLWMGWAVQQTGGEIVALGRPGGPDGPVAIYDMNGRALTGMIGDAFPERVTWSPDRRAVLIETANRRFVATTSGNITEITGQTSNTAVNWTR